MYLSSITEREYNKNKDLYNPVDMLKTDEDVATFVETFEDALHDITADMITDYVETKDNHYIFVYNEEKETNFDFYSVVNELYETSTNINIANIKLMFPVSMSRGLYEEKESKKGVENEPRTDVLEDDEAATTYIDEDELEDIAEDSADTDHKLFDPVNGNKIVIDEEGIIIGRSSKQSDYVIHGNSKISRRHCKVYKNGDKYYVHDYDSANGTLIDGLKVRPGVDREIPVGSTLTLADEEFRLL